MKRISIISIISIIILAGLLLAACGQSQLALQETAQAVANQTMTAQAQENLRQALVQTQAAENQAQADLQQTQVALVQTEIPLVQAQEAQLETLVAVSANQSQPASNTSSGGGAGKTSTPSAGSAQIQLTSVPPMGSSAPLQGVVKGVTPEKYAVACYIEVAGAWWTKPTFAQPVTHIRSDGTWSCQIVSGGNDAYATTLRAYLIPASYFPPAANNDPNPPAALDQLNLPFAEATR